MCASRRSSLSGSDTTDESNDSRHSKKNPRRVRRDAAADGSPDLYAVLGVARDAAPEDIARAVHFFAAESPYVTGQILAVDGGRSVNI